MNRLSWKIVAGPAFVCVSDVFSRALASGFSQGSEYLRLWTAYLDYLRRRVHWNEGINYFRFLFSRPFFSGAVPGWVRFPTWKRNLWYNFIGFGFFTSQMPFLLPCQQCQSAENNSGNNKLILQLLLTFVSFTIMAPNSVALINFFYLLWAIFTFLFDNLESRPVSAAFFCFLAFSHHPMQNWRNFPYRDFV